MEMLPRQKKGNLWWNLLWGKKWFHSAFSIQRFPLKQSRQWRRKCFLPYLWSRITRIPIELLIQPQSHRTATLTLNRPQKLAVRKESGDFSAPNTILRMESASTTSASTTLYSPGSYPLNISSQCYPSIYQSSNRNKRSIIFSCHTIGTTAHLIKFSPYSIILYQSDLSVYHVIGHWPIRDQTWPGRSNLAAAAVLTNNHTQPP